MRHLVKVASIAAGMIAFSGIGFAQQCKIAVINMQDVVVNSNDGKSKSALFDAKVAEWKKKIDAIQAAIDDAQTKLKNQSSIASASVINDLNKAISDKQKELQRTTEDAQKDVDEYRAQLLDPVMKVADDIKQEISSEKNFDIVYDTSAEGSAIIYVDKRCDMTEEVKKRMNAKAGTPAPAAKPIPPKPAENKPPAISQPPKPAAPK
jgi:outer membrane protein